MRQKKGFAVMTEEQKKQLPARAVKRPMLRARPTGSIFERDANGNKMRSDVPDNTVKYNIMNNGMQTDPKLMIKDYSDLKNLTPMQVDLLKQVVQYQQIAKPQFTEF